VKEVLEYLRDGETNEGMDVRTYMKQQVYEFTICQLKLSSFHRIPLQDYLRKRIQPNYFKNQKDCQKVLIPLIQMVS
jgi:hypothetical protein